jgi:hypothetical protein
MTENYDGFYFLPGKGDDEMAISFFEFGEELGNQKKVDSKNEVGDLWHIALFTQGEKGEPVFDPEVYVKNLCGTGIYGCVLRKTDKSVKWFNDYLDKVRNRVTIIKLK